MSAGLIFDDLSPNFLNVSQYQDLIISTEVKSYLVQSHIIVGHDGCYAMLRYGQGVYREETQWAL